MRKKSEFTIVERAIQTVDGFQKVFNTLQQQTILRGQSQSTLDNYIRQVALISLEFNKLPEDLSEDDINGYLTALALSPKSPSRSSFKHAIYGLRYYYRHIGQTKRAINLPSLKQEAKLPVILNREELRQLFKAPTLLKHRIALTLIYSAGLRSQEASNMKISDIDFVRKSIHIRQSKYKKDRIVPLSDYMAKGLKKYLAVEKPHIWCARSLMLPKSSIGLESNMLTSVSPIVLCYAPSMLCRNAAHRHWGDTKIYATPAAKNVSVTTVVVTVIVLNARVQNKLYGSRTE